MKSSSVGSARGASASALTQVQSKRWRTATVALLVLALVGSLLALAVPPPSVAGAQTPPGNTTTTSWTTDCAGYAIGARQPETNAIAIETTAPAQVSPDEVFTIRIAPVASSFPDSKDSIIGVVPVHFLQNINFMYDLPTNATVQSVSIVSGSGFGLEGTPSVAVSSTPPPFATKWTTPYEPPRIIMQVPKVPKNAINPDLSTPFQLPAIDVVVKAIGALGSNVATRFSGHDEPSSGYVFQASSTAMAEVYCWPAGNVPSPVLSTTVISNGGQSLPTTTELEVAPTTLPGGNEVSMTATVTAPSGAVRFNDGVTVLGLAELDVDGKAHLSVPLNSLGQRSITATFLGAAGFESSTSAPVAVTVTNPANRTPVQLTVVPSLGSPTVSVTVSPTAGEVAVPTGLVRLFLDGSLVGTQTLIDGTTTLPRPNVGAGGHEIRADYLGDVEYFPGSGWTGFGQTPNLALSRVVSGTLALNGATGPISSSSSLDSTFATDSSGVETLGGLLRSGISSLATSTGSVQGRLTQVGAASGQIAAGSDGLASFSSQFMFQVTAADFGSGDVGLADTCVVGPFPVEMTGTRMGVDGELALSAAGVFIPAAAQGSCVDPQGISRASQISSLLAGASTEFSLGLTPPPAGAPTTVTALTFNPAGGSSFGQPVAVGYTVSTTGAPFFFTQGFIELFVNGSSFANVRVSGINGSSHTGSITFPASAAGAPVPDNPPLPQGNNLSIRARFIPESQAYAASTQSSSFSYTVLSPIEKATPSIALEVPEEAEAGDVVTATITMDPAPSSVSDFPALAGRIRIYDRAEPDPSKQLIPVLGDDFSNPNSLWVSPSSGGSYSTPIALAPGAHSLQAVFTPAVNSGSFQPVNSAWAWNSAESSAVEHTVLGEAIPTTVTLVDESTRGTGKVALNQALYLKVQVDPRAMTALGPAAEVPLFYQRPDGEYTETMVDPNGQATITVTGGLWNNTVGPKSFSVFFDPFMRSALGPAYAANQGFSPSSFTFNYEVVTPGSPGPMLTGTQITSVNPAPAVQGTAWSQVNGHVSFNAAGSVSYLARNTESAQTYALGTANVSTSTSASTGRGLARLNNSAVTASIPAGTYEVWGNFTPTNPVNFAPSSSAPFIVHVVSPGSPVASSTELTVSPSGTSFPGEGVILTANVSPTYAAGGTVEFFDGETSLGTATSAFGSAQMMVFDLADGEHSLKATFTPTNASTVTGSTSPVVTHTVTEPAIETSTSLEVSPTGPVQLGDDVTFTATISPSDAPGSVLFEDAEGDLAQTVPVTDGQATLTTDELEAGTHNVTATFVPSDPTDYTESESEPVSITVVSGPVSTETSLVISPETSASIGDEVTLTATIEPSDATGTVTFYDGDVPLTDAIAVIGGEAQAVKDDLPIGTYDIDAVFEPSDPELWASSSSPAQSYEITLPSLEPVFACQGTDAISIGLMEGIVAPPDGILYLETPIVATVPEQLANGSTGPVSFTWTAVLPENLANLAIEAQAEEIYMEDMTIAMEASGGSTQTWAFPETHTITDPTAPIVLETSGTVTASSVADIIYSVRSPLLLTIHVPPTPLVSAHVYVNLSCTVANATQAVTQVTSGATAPGAPTNVTATPGPLQANVSWSPPANDGGSAITGYVITSSPDNKVIHTSANVTSIDFIGLTAGQSYTFTVQAINDVGTSEESVASSPTTPTAGKNFTDVPTSNPFHAEIEWLYATGITTGTGPDTFGPNNNLTRQAMAAFLYRMDGSPNGADPTCDSAPFPDVPTTNAFCGEIQWLKDQGITTVPSDQNFGPGLNLKRQAMAAYLYRFAGSPNGLNPTCVGSGPFPDVPATNAFCGEIAWMSEVGITKVPSDQNFGPGLDMKRQAMAAFLYRYTLVEPTGL